MSDTVFPSNPSSQTPSELYCYLINICGLFLHQHHFYKEIFGEQMQIPSAESHGSMKNNNLFLIIILSALPAVFFLASPNHNGSCSTPKLMFLFLSLWDLKLMGVVQSVLLLMCFLNIILSFPRKFHFPYYGNVMVREDFKEEEWFSALIKLLNTNFVVFDT